MERLMELFNDRPILLIAGSIALFILGGHFNLLRLVKLAKLIPWFRESRKDGEITPRAARRTWREAVLEINHNHK